MTSAALCVVAALSALGWRHLARRRACTRVDPRRELASLAAHLARSTRSGTTLNEAFSIAAPRLGGIVGRDTGDLVRALERGSSLEEATRRWLESTSAASTRAWVRVTSEVGGGTKERLDRQDLGLLVCAVQFSDRQGAGLSDAFDAVAMALMDRAELREEVAALTSQASMSVWVLCAIPVLGLVMLPVLAPEVFVAMFSTRVGVLLLLAATSLDATAILACSRITSRVLR
ncbi:MAG: type II secretion system F family protein [Microthrixaceae bacterium]